MTLVADWWGMHGDVGAGWWIVMALSMALFWGAAIALVVWLVRGAPAAAGRAQPEESAIDVLDRRLAAGDISPEEYEQRRALLRGGSTTQAGS